MQGAGSGAMRLWPVEIYSDKIRNRVIRGALSNGEPYDEWSIVF